MGGGGDREEYEEKKRDGEGRGGGGGRRECSGLREQRSGRWLNGWGKGDDGRKE